MRLLGHVSRIGEDRVVRKIYETIEGTNKKEERERSEESNGSRGLMWDKCMDEPYTLNSIPK